MKVMLSLKKKISIIVGLVTSLFPLIVSAQGCQPPQCIAILPEPVTYPLRRLVGWLIYFVIIIEAILLPFFGYNWLKKNKKNKWYGFFKRPSFLVSIILLLILVLGYWLVGFVDEKVF